MAQAEGDGAILGLYILHPNNIGRCGHICNASYAWRRTPADAHRGKAGDRLRGAGEAHGFRILQFNAVVATNVRARRLYERLGFVPLGLFRAAFA